MVLRNQRGGGSPQLVTASSLYRGPPCGRTHSLRSIDQPTAPAAAKATYFSTPASCRTTITISTAMASRKARTGLSKGSSGDRQYAPGWETDHAATIRRH
jgi:hypothetical protein